MFLIMSQTKQVPKQLAHTRPTAAYGDSGNYITEPHGWKTKRQRREKGTSNKQLMKEEKCLPDDPMAADFSSPVRWTSYLPHKCVDFLKSAKMLRLCISRTSAWETSVCSPQCCAWWRCAAASPSATCWTERPSTRTNCTPSAGRSLKSWWVQVRVEFKHPVMLLTKTRK